MTMVHAHVHHCDAIQLFQPNQPAFENVIITFVIRLVGWRMCLDGIIVTLDTAVGYQALMSQHR